MRKIYGVAGSVFDNCEARMKSKLLTNATSLTTNVVAESVTEAATEAIRYFKETYNLEFVPYVTELTKII